MPLNRLLHDAGHFNPEGVIVLLNVFEGVVAQLDLKTPAEKEVAARHVMLLAQGQAELDAVSLRDRVLAAMRH